MARLLSEADAEQAEKGFWKLVKRAEPSFITRAHLRSVCQLAGRSCKRGHLHEICRASV